MRHDMPQKIRDPIGEPVVGTALDKLKITTA